MRPMLCDDSDIMRYFRLERQCVIREFASFAVFATRISIVILFAEAACLSRVEIRRGVVHRAPSLRV